MVYLTAENLVPTKVSGNNKSPLCFCPSSEMMDSETVTALRGSQI